MNAKTVPSGLCNRVTSLALSMVLSLLLGSCLRQTGPGATSASPSAEDPIVLSQAASPISERNRALGAGVNLGNALEAPSEGEWGVKLEDQDFKLVAQAGFRHVRIPVRWSEHALAQPPYTIDEAFAARVKWAVDSALAAGLRAIFNVHHYEEMAQEPDQHKQRLIAIWSQLAEKYQGYPDSLYFELFNEPNKNLTADKNNRLIAELLTAIRPTNPRRAVVVGSVQYNSFRGLPYLELPAHDQNLIVTFHYYDPFDFTHQGAPWVDRQHQLGIDWPGKVGVQANIGNDFNRAVEWANQHNRPLYLGEFGAYKAAQMDARVRWTTAVVEEAVLRGLPYAYWELRSGFGLYDYDRKDWRRPLLNAVLPPAPSPQPTSWVPSAAPRSVAQATGLLAVH
jgi:endoglucanase